MGLNGVTSTFIVKISREKISILIFLKFSVLCSIVYEIIYIFSSGLISRMHVVQVPCRTTIAQSHWD